MKCVTSERHERLPRVKRESGKTFPRQGQRRVYFKRYKKIFLMGSLKVKSSVKINNGIFTVYLAFFFVSAGTNE